jgi:hypothetical protein
LSIVFLPEDIAVRCVKATIQLETFPGSHDSIPFCAGFGGADPGLFDAKAASFGPSQFATPDALLNPFALDMFPFIYNGLTVHSG